MSVRVSILSSGLLYLLLISVLPADRGLVTSHKEERQSLQDQAKAAALSRAVVSSFSRVPRSIRWNFLQGHWIMTLVKVFPVWITTSEFSTSPLVALHWIVLVPLFRKLTWVGLLTESPKMTISGRIIHLARRGSLLLSDFEAQPIFIFPRPLLTHQPGVSAPHSFGP